MANIETWAQKLLWFFHIVLHQKHINLSVWFVLNVNYFVQKFDLFRRTHEHAHNLNGWQFLVIA